MKKVIAPFKNKIWLASPTMHGEELQYMQEAYSTNWMSTVGANINEVERITAEMTGASHAVALASGTAALHLAMKLAGVKQGDKVFCSDVTFAATVNPVLYEKAQPIFIDSEYETWNMDPVLLEEAIKDRIAKTGRKPKAIVLVYLYGIAHELCQSCSNPLMFYGKCSILLWFRRQ